MRTNCCSLYCCCGRLRTRACCRAYFRCATGSQRYSGSAEVQGNIRLWDSATGKLIKEIPEVSPFPVQLRFLAGGRTLVMGSGDGTLKIFEVQ